MASFEKLANNTISDSVGVTYPISVRFSFTLVILAFSLLFFGCAEGQNASSCIPECSGFSCGEMDPVCDTPCGDPCDSTCFAHCTNDAVDCDETGIDCGGSACVSCDCSPDCTGYSCGEIETTCNSTCGDKCDTGCNAHCSNGTQDCDETDIDCGGSTCAGCDCEPDCTGISCGATEPTCMSTCGNACDPGCTTHCINGVQDCDETGVDCGGGDCSSCSCVPDCTGLDCGWIESNCGTPCGSACDSGCNAHCSNGAQDCDETGADCGGSTCAACVCVPNCTGLSCGDIESTCGTFCGSPCDAGCTAHCYNGVQDCDETETDCGGNTCSACVCVPNCSGVSCGTIESNCGTACGTACDSGCTAHCSNGTQDCDETGTDCGGSTCSACASTCGNTCFYYTGSCNSAYIGACDGCDMGCEVHDPDCDDSPCMDSCSCLADLSHWYCDGWDDCVDSSCECSGE